MTLQSHFQLKFLSPILHLYWHPQFRLRATLERPNLRTFRLAKLQQPWQRTWQAHRQVQNYACATQGDVGMLTVESTWGLPRWLVKHCDVSGQGFLEEISTGIWARKLGSHQGDRHLPTVVSLGRKRNRRGKWAPCLDWEVRLLPALDIRAPGLFVALPKLLDLDPWLRCLFFYTSSFQMSGDLIPGDAMSHTHTTRTMLWYIIQ